MTSVSEHTAEPAAEHTIDIHTTAGKLVEFDTLARHRSTTFGLADKRPLGDGVVTGYGTVDGRDVCIFSQDATVFGGSLGEVYGEKIVKVQDLALKTGQRRRGRPHPGADQIGRAHV